MTRHPAHDIYTYLGAHPAEQGFTFRVWAPNARAVALAGDFNGWQPRPMTRLDTGVWETAAENAKVYDAYKYVVTGADGRVVWKADPCAFHAATRPGTDSKVYDLSGYQWRDDDWRQQRLEKPPVNGELLIYEVHLGSWKRHEDGSPLSYVELAKELPSYVKAMGYNFVELLPVAEYPLDDSWGYQCTGYFAPTSRYGTPHDFMALVDALHRAGLGVIMDWVPAHFCKDSHGLIEFDGTCLYEYGDPLKWEHAGWGTRVFDFGKPEVREFLLSSAVYWLKEYHIDGLRVDAVASMLYLDYDRQGGAWRPNKDGGRENLEAIDFLRELNRAAFAADPAALMVAEESTAWPLVTYPPEQGGLGFNLKWNMGWMNDLCHYLKMDPYFRQFHHRDVTFSMVYAFSENYVLPLSHDEVVHMKGSLRGKMPGDDWRQLAGVRSFWAYMLCHPGKKLLFMGSELPQWHEWDFRGQLDWYLLDDPACRASHECLRQLNRLYKRNRCLWENDRDWDGFTWLVADDNHNNVLVFLRRDRRGHELICAVNFAPVPWDNYRFGVPAAARYEVLFNTDDACWGGSGCALPAGSRIDVDEIPSHGRETSLSLTIPPLGAVLLRREGKRPRKKQNTGGTQG